MDHGINSGLGLRSRRKEIVNFWQCWNFLSIGSPRRPRKGEASEGEGGTTTEGASNRTQSCHNLVRGLTIRACWSFVIREEPVRPVICKLRDGQIPDIKSCMILLPSAARKKAPGREKFEINTSGKAPFPATAFTADLLFPISQSLAVS